MKLPACWSCEHKFQWRELLFTADGRKRCKKCKSIQFITTHSNWRIGVVTYLGSFIPIISIVSGLNWLLVILLSLVALIITMSLMPYQYEFTDEKQPLF